VGHSYGGVVITEAGDDPKVLGPVYIAAFAPDVGQSVSSLGANVEPAPAIDGVPWFVITGTGVFPMYAITGISGKLGGAAARALLAAGQPVRAVLRDPEKAKRWSDLGCEVANGVACAWPERGSLAPDSRGQRGRSVTATLNTVLRTPVEILVRNWHSGGSPLSGATPGTCVCIANEMPAARIDIISKPSSTIIVPRIQGFIATKTLETVPPEDLHLKEGPELSELI
jgi:hypothetical protein